MDFTLSPDYFTHTGTGQRMHKEDQAVPSAWSDKDANSVIWSLMEILKAGGVAGVQFDPDVPSTYQALLQAIRNINAESTSDRAGRVSVFLQPTAPPGWLLADGSLLSRATYSALWAHVQTVGAVSEATWAAGQHGWFSAGDGATTFRIPDLRSIVIRGLDAGRGLDPARLIGSFQDSQNKSHFHAVTDPGHVHGVTDPGHAHPTGSSGAGAPSGSDLSAVGYGPATLTGGANTGISIVSALTGISIQASGGTEARMINVALPHYIKY